jgi:Family of unknown function (DUF6069)
MATGRVEIRQGQLDARAAGRRPGMRWGRLFVVGVGAVVASTIANVLVAQALGSLLQVPATFRSLQTASVAPLTAIGVVGAVLVFAVLVRLRTDPVRSFTVVAMIALVISWVPDLLLYANERSYGTTLAEVLSLMFLHVAAASIAVFLLGRYGLRPREA